MVYLMLNYSFGGNRVPEYDLIAVQTFKGENSVTDYGEEICVG